LISRSITYRIAVGPRAGQKLSTLQTLPAREAEQQGDHRGAASAGGFSLHAEDALPRRHDPHRAGTSGPDGAPGGTGAIPADASDALPRAQRLQRVFGIDIEEPQVIAKILAHLEKRAPDQHPLPLGAVEAGFGLAVSPPSAR